MNENNIIIGRSYHLPGDSLQLSNSDMVLSILLRGEVHFNHWSEKGGEIIKEKRGQFSFLGLAAHPHDITQSFRIKADDIAALGCASGPVVDEVMKEAPGIHRHERLQLIKAMRQHPVFSNLSFWDCYKLSYYFYKVQLNEGDVISRKGSHQSYVYYVRDGAIERYQEKERGWSESKVLLEEGCFPGIDAVLNNQPSVANYTVKKDATIYLLNPSVLKYFVGGCFNQVNSLLDLLRNPNNLSIQTMVEDAIAKVSAINTEETKNSMNTGFTAVKNYEQIDVTEELEEKIHQLIQLLRSVYCEDEKEGKQDQHSHKEGYYYALATGIDYLKESSLLSAITSIQNFVMDLFYSSSSTSETSETPETSETSETTNEEEPTSLESLSTTLERYQKYHHLSDYSDEQILALLHAFQLPSIEAIASYLFFISLTGISEACSLTKKQFVQQAKNAKFLTEVNEYELTRFFFGDKDSINYSDFITKLQASDLPSCIQYFILFSLIK